MNKNLLIALAATLLLTGCGDTETEAKPKAGPPTPTSAQVLMTKGFTPTQARKLAASIERGRAASAVVRHGATTPFSRRFLKIATCD